MLVSRPRTFAIVLTGASDGGGGDDYADSMRNRFVGAV